MHVRRILAAIYNEDLLYLSARVAEVDDTAAAATLRDETFAPLEAAFFAFA